MKESVVWSSPANIALIKYWGKVGLQLPANPSLSMTLDTARTVTEIRMEKRPGDAGRWVYKYAGKININFENKISVFFERIKPMMPFINEVLLTIDSENNFPHSSGISSSASFMSSLALCLCDLENQYLKLNLTQTELIIKTSEIARMGSGSASRSVYGGYSVWGKCETENSSNKYAISINKLVHPVFQNYHDAVLIISSAPKTLSSTDGHELMKHNPYSETRYMDAEVNLKSLLFALKTGDQDLYIKIIEQEALTLHGLIMLSENGNILMKAKTIEAIELIREYRKKTGSKCCFTLDAGPNLHLLYPKEEKEMITSFIAKSLAGLCEQGKWIDDKIGIGPIKIK